MKSNQYKDTNDQCVKCNVNSSIYQLTHPGYLNQKFTDSNPLNGPLYRIYNCFLILVQAKVNYKGEGKADWAVKRFSLCSRFLFMVWRYPKSWMGRPYLLFQAFESKYFRFHFDSYQIGIRAVSPLPVINSILKQWVRATQPSIIMEIWWDLWPRDHLEQHKVETSMIQFANRNLIWPNEGYDRKTQGWIRQAVRKSVTAFKSPLATHASHLHPATAL